MSEALVFLRHPTLPADQWIEVTAESRVHYSGAGWQLVPDEEVAACAAAAAHELACAEARMAGVPEPTAPLPPDVGDDAALPDPEPAEAQADAADQAAEAAPKKRSR